MTTEEGGETLKPPEKFRITNYWEDGEYGLDGRIIGDFKLSAEEIGKWEENNQRLGGKAWAAGQALYFHNQQPLIFGRSTDADVVISYDFTPAPAGQLEEDQLQPDPTVSRKHLRLEPLAEGRIAIEDLGSTNGLRIYHDGQKAAYLQSDIEDIQDRLPAELDILEVGDAVIIGDGSAKERRVLGFKVCQDENNQLCLVKFNLENIGVFENLLQQSLKKTQPEQLEPEMTLDEALKRPGMEFALEAAINLLSQDIAQYEMRRINWGLDRKAFEKAKVFYEELFIVIQDMGHLHLSGDFLLAARLMGEYARKKDEQKNNDATAIGLPKLEAIMMRIAEGKLVE